MKINYAGKVELSTIDWHGHAAYVLFLNGCPLRCPRCHNAQLRKAENWVRIATPLADICKALPFINHLVVSGGEPLMQPEACLKINEFAHLKGMKVAVETSGCLPLVDGFDKVMIGVQCSLRRGVYDSYVRKLGSFDNLIANLTNLDPGRTEIRLILFKDSKYDLQSLKILTPFPIRILAGVGIGICTDVHDLENFAVNLSIDLGYKIKERSAGWILLEN